MPWKQVYRMQKTKVEVLLFDVSPFYYMAYYGALFVMQKAPGRNITQEIDPVALMDVTKNILISKIRSCFEMFEGKPIIPVFCYDGFPVHKQQLEKEYKAGRTTNVPAGFKKDLRSIVRLFPGFHLYNKEEEADDLIATIKAKLKECENIDPTFYIFSKDNDLLQLCDYRTCFYDPANNKGYRNREYLKEKFNGISNFKHIILHKICFGDSSDNIEGIFKGKRRKAIVEAFSGFKSFKEFLTSDLIENEELYYKAKELYYMIHLKENLEYSSVLNEDDSFLRIDVNFFKNVKI